jgi:N-acetylglucosamine-6-phosphate deacetylase
VLVSAGRVVTPDAVLAPGWVRLDGAVIGEVGAGAPPRPADGEAPEGILVPGYVDSHVHGGGGASFGAGGGQAAETVARAHRAHGTTTMAASLVTDDAAALRRSVEQLVPLVADGVLAGLHLEGPWLSPSHAGAHSLDLLRRPTPEEVDSLVEVAAGHLRMVTLAPELPGGVEAVRRLVGAGVTVAVGHTDASYAETCAALDAGASVGTHLFNAMRGLHHREPGPVAALLEHPGAHIELIADGVHLHPAVLRLAATRKPEQAVLVTDAMAAAGAGDGDYRLGPMQVRVRDGVARLADGGAIAGSTLTMAAAVRFAVRTAGLPLLDVVRAATSTPAAVLGLSDVGALVTGRRADLVVLDHDLDVQRVMRGGVWLVGD